MANTIKATTGKSRPPAVRVREDGKEATHKAMLALIRAKLEQSDNMSEIARELGIARRTLYRYLHELGVLGIKTVLVSGKDGSFQALSKPR